jgi:hypothetical protein
MPSRRRRTTGACQPRRDTPARCECRDRLDSLLPPRISGPRHQSQGVLPVWAKGLGESGLQGLAALRSMLRERLTPLLDPSRTGIQRGAPGWSRHGGYTVRPPHAAARVSPAVIAYDGPWLCGKGSSPLTQKEPKAGTIQPREEPTDRPGATEQKHPFF